MIDPAERGTWREIEARLRPFIARRVRAKADVDDVLQDVFVRLQRGLAGLRDEQRFGPWLYQVARSAIVDHQRVAARHRVGEPQAMEEAPLHVEDDGVEAEVAGYLAPLVAMLPSPYREALTLVELEGRTHREAAELLGVSVSGMKSRVQRGRAQLLEALEACCRIALDVRGRVMACEARADGRLPTGWQGSSTGAARRDASTAEVSRRRSPATRPAELPEGSGHPRHASTGLPAGALLVASPGQAEDDRAE
jgi:RNA polymerase sigma-70 factor (ECF subfamily)